MFCVVDQRVAGTPANRIVMNECLGTVHQPAVSEQLDNNWISFFEKLSCDGCDFFQKVAIQSNSMDNRQSICFGKLEIVFAVRRRRMYDTRTIFDCDKVRTIYLADFSFGRKIVKQSLILDTSQFVAFHFLDDFAQ